MISTYLLKIQQMILKISAVIAFLMGVVVALFFSGFLYFILTLEQDMYDRTTVADGIVVLTGGQGRVSFGVSLLKSGLGKRLFISGVHKGVSPQMLVNTQDMKPEDIIYLGHETLGYTAQDTIGNAAETQTWIKHHHIRSLRLVTADYHMKRSLLELRHLVPDITVIPTPLKVIHDFNEASLKILWGEYIKLMVRYCKIKGL